MFSCGVRGCVVKNVTMLGRVCPHCNLRYCTPHAMAEKHGCGAHAKVCKLTLTQTLTLTQGATQCK